MPTTTQRTSIPPATAGIVIIGAGLAGLFTALKLAPLPVTIISPTPLGEGASSGWAQGGIAAAIGEGDHPDKHVADTLIAGAGLVDENIARLVTSEAANRIADLLSYGVPFDKDLEGRLKLSREAAHSERRIVRVKGDMAGKAIMAALITAVRQTPSIQVLEGFRANTLLKEKDRICGLNFSRYSDDDAHLEFTAHTQAIVLASGGIGGLYSVTTNPSTSRGEGLGMAARAGAVLSDLEFVQFHPTALNVNLDPAPLATEALRGEGALLVNGEGNRFMTHVHPDAELAPRDIVARAVHIEVTSGRGAYLECREAIGARFAENYPTVFAKCKQAGIDPVTDLIPIAPAAHYHMGGIWTDENGRASLDGLWACGEVASTGMHGANRLASNSLLEAIVFAARIAENIRQTISSEQANSKTNITVHSVHSSDAKQIVEAIALLRQTMSHYVGVVRSEYSLRQALKIFDELKARHLSSVAFTNMLSAAELITLAALARKESRGGHYRSDYPDTMPELAKRSMIVLPDQEQNINQDTDDIPHSKMVAAQ